LADEALSRAIAEFVDGSNQEVVQLAVGLISSGGINDTSSILELRSLDPRLANPLTVQLIHSWRVADRDKLTGQVVALAMQAAVHAKTLQGGRATAIEIVGTGPIEAGSSLRTSAQVVSEMVVAAKRYILVVGYSINFDLLRRGATGRLLEDLIAAANRGIQVRLLLHDDPHNKEALLRAWPRTGAMPQLLTWVDTSGDSMFKLHAKLLVVDDRDMLVTSANLSYHGLEKNVELGVRLRGPEAQIVRAHFDNLERYGHIVQWSASIT